jgi:hypothetical protein
MHIVQQLNNWAAWALPNPGTCPCHGSGWLISDFDTFHRCGFHGGPPHPEDQEGVETFDYEAHRLSNLREAYVTYRAAAGMDNVLFRACVVRRAGPGATPQQMVDAADEIAEEAVRDREEGEARRQGFSCALEMRWDEDARLEQQYGPDY